MISAEVAAHIPPSKEAHEGTSGTWSKPLCLHSLLQMPSANLRPHHRPPLVSPPRARLSALSPTRITNSYCRIWYSCGFLHFFSSPISISHNIATFPKFRPWLLSFTAPLSLQSTRNYQIQKPHFNCRFPSRTRSLGSRNKTCVAKVLCVSLSNVISPFERWGGGVWFGIPAGGLIHHGPPLDKTLLSALNTGG